MKKINSILACLLLTASLFFAQQATAQAPQKMSYQSVLRNSSNVLLAGTQVGIRISVLQGSETGPAVYVETQTATTNSNGLLSIKIGMGTATTGTFAGINWAAGTYFIKTETDPTGGSNYSITGTQEILSVPYAMYAAKSGDAANAWSLNGNLGTLDSINFIGTSDSVPLNIKVNNKKAGRIDPTTYNTFWGYQAGSQNTIGSSNTAIGASALYSNTTGFANTGIGIAALGSNLTGNYNTASGSESQLQNITGNRNTAFGKSSLIFNKVGSDNTAVGYRAGISTKGSNNISIGSEADVPFSEGNGQIRIGDRGITYAGVQVAWTITSDKRWKSDIQPSNLGLDFISKLKSVSYTRNNDERKKREYGFIAQDLEETLNSSGASDNGIISKDDAGMYGVRYNDLMSPMVKAIQEQQELIKTLNIKMDTMQKEIDMLKSKK